MDREYTEEPATHPADLGTNGAMRLGSAILGLLLLQGYSSQPTTTQTSQEMLQKSSQASLISSQPVTPRSSTMDKHSISLPNLMSFQPQKHTLGPGTGVPESSSSSSSSSSSRSRRGEASLDATPSPETASLWTNPAYPLPTPTSESVLTVAAFGVISFIVILVVVVIVLVSVVSLRFKCRKNKESEDPQKPGSSGLPESCSTANGEKDSITLISMKNINMNNSTGCASAEKIL
ncbi:endothelial cell-specific chemotaxis regulator isoform X4 [Apodemus sylvaticus]|uniref:endothelial cell-specific chemotaxis regulator isoform X4 n=1 Tax=Apodemus sylvaticus TaxID=10129 RepID=UPI00224433BE|nr:endothelial cell-specific chemotaxis regulator isoform X4 [Apodemus sylvaticus]